MRNIFKHYRWLVVFIIMALLIINSASAELKIHFIDVGQGNSILIQCNDMYLLVDAGPEEAGGKVHDYLTEKLKTTQLDYVIATHEHDDHIGGMQEALSGMIIKKIYSGGSIPMSYWFNSILPLVQGDAFSVVKPEAGESFILGNAVISFLKTMSDAENANDRCIVFRIDYGKNSALFMSDLEGEGENFLLNGQNQLQADVLQVGHHGGNTSTGEQFLRAVSPQIAVISVGTGNKHGHPHNEVIKRLDKYNVTVYRTDWFGSIVLTSDGTDWTIEVSRAR